MDTVVAGPADGKEELCIIEARLPPPPSMMYVACGRVYAHLTAGVFCKIHFADLHIELVLLCPFLAYATHRPMGFESVARTE